jgi:hypothetical protein
MRLWPALVVLGVAPVACFRSAAIECDGPAPPRSCDAGLSAGSDASGGTTTIEKGSSSGSSGASTDAGEGEVSTSGTASTEALPGVTTGASTDASTSTGPAAYCGDGVVQPGPPLFEECDDSFSDEGNCNLLCKRDRVVFVASLPLFKAGGLQGIKGADNYCVSRAGMAGLPQFLLFKAFLSDSQHDAGTRLFNGKGRYVLVDGTVVADDWVSFITEPLQHPIELTEKGEVLHVAVWTGTEFGTGKLVPGAGNCDDWTSKDINKEAYFGFSDEVDALWVYSNILNPTDCINERSIYCVEQQ